MHLLHLLFEGDLKNKQQTQNIPMKSPTQKQAVKNNWFCIVIQVNGKIQETNKGD